MTRWTLLFGAYVTHNSARIQYTAYSRGFRGFLSHNIRAARGISWFSMKLLKPECVWLEVRIYLARACRMADKFTDARGPERENNPYHATYNGTHHALCDGVILKIVTRWGSHWPYCTANIVVPPCRQDSYSKFAVSACGLNRCAELGSVLST